MIRRKRRSRKWGGSARATPARRRSDRVDSSARRGFDPRLGAAAEQGGGTRRLGGSRRSHGWPGRGRRTPEAGDGFGSGRTKNVGSEGEGERENRRGGGLFGKNLIVSSLNEKKREFSLFIENSQFSNIHNLFIRTPNNAFHICTRSYRRALQLS